MRSCMVLKARATSTSSLAPRSSSAADGLPRARSRAARARRLSGRLCQCISKPVKSSSNRLVKTIESTCCGCSPSGSRLTYGAGIRLAMYSHSLSPMRIWVTSTGGFTGSRVSA